MNTQQTPIKLFIDDVRNPPDDTWIIARDFNTAIQYINTTPISIINFDHDLGENKTGYDIAEYIERLAFYNKIAKMRWHIHSANPVGRNNIERTMLNADKFWSKN